MRYSRFLSLVLTAALVALGSQAFATYDVTVTVDENGNGTVDASALPEGPVSPIALTWTLATDHGPGGLSNALTYSFANIFGPYSSLVAVTQGDVLMYENFIGDDGHIGDVFRFEGTNGSNASGVFYSETGPGENSLADIGLPTAHYLSPMPAQILEVDGVGVYTPTAGQPGYVDTSSLGFQTQVTYDLISDVPEPVSFAVWGLAGLSAAAAVAVRRRRTSAPRN
jgi:MYXO-CTERM domain-containing protein